MLRSCLRVAARRAGSRYRGLNVDAEVVPFLGTHVPPPGCEAEAASDRLHPPTMERRDAVTSRGSAGRKPLSRVGDRHAYGVRPAETTTRQRGLRWGRGAQIHCVETNLLLSASWVAETRIAHLGGDASLEGRHVLASSTTAEGVRGEKASHLRSVHEPVGEWVGDEAHNAVGTPRVPVLSTSLARGIRAKHSRG